MTVQYEIEEIIGHLGAALNQSTASDDQIIVGHIKAAYEAALAISKGWNRHYHVAGTAIGKPADMCALCGYDLRHEVHLRERKTLQCR